MREAFDMVKLGKEQALKDAHHIFFAKRKVIVDKYNTLTKTYARYQEDVKKEIEIKDKINSQWQKRHAKIVEELKMAKIVLSDKNMA